MSEQPKDDKHWEQYRKPKGSKMKKIKLIGIMFFLSLCSYFVVIYDNTIRTVEFLSIFAAGDATTIPYKQIIVACGDGSNAGLSAFNYLEKLKGKPGVRADWKKQIGGQVFHY